MRRPGPHGNPYVPARLMLAARWNHFLNVERRDDRFHFAFGLPHLGGCIVRYVTDAERSMKLLDLEEVDRRSLPAIIVPGHRKRGQHIFARQRRA